MDNFSANTYNAPPPPPEKNILGIKFTPKFIFIILGVVILVEIVIALRSLTSSTPPPLVDTNVSQAVSGVAKISLVVSGNNFKAGDVIPVSVVIDTAGRLINGVDLIIRFDPKILDATDKDIIKGSLFDDYPMASVDSAKGLILISGISNAQKGIKVSGQFIAINLKAKAPGKTSLAIDFEKGTTTHSNLVEQSTISNILEKVDNLEINIQ